MLILLPLLILVVLTFFSMITSGGSLTDLSIGYYGYGINLNPITGIVSLILVIIIVGALVGIQVLGSGLADASVSTIRTGVGYGGLWALFSILSYNLIVSIEVFGFFLYATLTICYTIGVIGKIGEA